MANGVDNRLRILVDTGDYQDEEAFENEIFYHHDEHTDSSASSGTQMIGAGVDKTQLQLALGNVQGLDNSRLTPMDTTPKYPMPNNAGSSTPRLRISTPRCTTPVNQPVNAETETKDDSEKKEKIRSGPSSRRTVLIIAGLFVVGLILILSGVIVLATETHPAFQAAGGIFLSLGVIFFFICLFLQKKNVKKLVNELEKDLYFLNVTDNKVWNMIFHFDEQLNNWQWQHS